MSRFQRYQCSGSVLSFSLLYSDIIMLTWIIKLIKWLNFECLFPAPVHFLVIPKARIPMLEKATDDDSQILGHLLNVARKVAAQENLEKGFLVLVKISENF